MKKKYKRAGTTSERQDYRKGGQVSKDGPRQKFQYGGVGGYPINFGPTTFTPEQLAQIQTTVPTTGQTQLNTGANMAMTEEEKAANRAELEQAKEGQVPVAGQIPDVQQVDASVPQQTTTMPTATTVGQTQVATTPAEQVTTIEPPQTVATGATVGAGTVCIVPTVAACSCGACTT